MHNPSDTLQPEIFKWRKYDIIWFIDNLVKKCRQFGEGIITENYYSQTWFQEMLDQTTNWILLNIWLYDFANSFGVRYTKFSSILSIAYLLNLILACLTQTSVRGGGVLYMTNSICDMPVFSNIGPFDFLSIIVINWFKC